MPRPNRKKVSDITESISKHAATRGVTIFIDGDNKSQAFLRGQTFEFDKESKVLTIVLDKLNDQEKDVVLDIIKDYFEKHGLVLSSEQEEILEKYQSYTEYNPYTDLLDLYTGKIPVNDLNALKMSLYMKICKEDGKNIDQIKQQIRDRFGNRGAYIANLCNAGYFEDTFKKQCFKLSPEKFTEYYELRVGQELAALFVHTGLNLAAMQESFQEKVSSCSRNGVSRFRVLGFGRRNVEIIKEFKAKYEDFDWGYDIEWSLKIESPPPHNGLEYDIVIQ